MNDLAAKKAAAQRRQRRKAKRAERRVASRKRAVFLVRVAVASIRWMPMGLACALGDALGSFVYLVGVRWRRHALENIAAAMPELSPAKRRHIVRRNFALIGRGAFAFVVAHRMGPERALTYIRVEDESAGRALEAEGKGVIMTTFHYGCFEMFAAWLGRVYGGRAVGRESDEDGPTAVLLKMRREFGIDVIERGDPREIVRALKANKPVAFLVDQDTSDVNGAFVPFFGRPAYTPLGPAVLAVRMGAPILMGFVAWESLTRHKAYSVAVLRPRADLPQDEAVLELTARMTRIGEEEVRKRPDHWVWFHRRWRTRPEDRPNAPVYDPGKP